MQEPADSLRLDKWLWQARFYKTRTVATQMVSRGKVRVNSRITRKAATVVRPGDVLTLVQGNAVRVVEVLSLPERRGPASEASRHFRDVNQD